MKASTLIFAITLLVAGGYAGRFLEIYADGDCITPIAVDWCPECTTSSDVDCEASGGGSSNYYSITYDYDFVYKDDIPADFVRVAYSSTSDCNTIDATTAGFSAVASDQLDQCLGFYEGGFNGAIKLGGCVSGEITFQYYDISSTCNYNSPLQTFTSSCAEIGSSGVHGLGACANEPLFGFPAAPTSVNTPTAEPVGSNTPTSGPVSNTPAANNGPSNTPTGASTPVTKSSDAAQVTAFGVLSAVALML